MVLSASQIDRSTAWLLSNGSPPVRYLTHKYLINSPSGSTAITDLGCDVQTCKDAEEIFSKQREDGSWCSGGSWAQKPPYLQKKKSKRFFYHGHSTIHELLMFTEHKVGLEEEPVQVLLEWLMTMYHADEGCFTYTGKSISEYSRRKDGMDSRVAKYRLYHLIEDDWLTYYATRIAANLDKI